jgi:hypothetical protein
MFLVLAGWRASPFAKNQASAFESYKFVSRKRLSMLSESLLNEVLSAYKSESNWVASGRSLIKSKTVLAL